MRRPRRPLAAGWYFAGAIGIFLFGAVGTLYLGFACYGLSVSAWWWAGKCALAATCCWNVAVIILHWLLADWLRRSKKQPGQSPDTLDPSQASDIDWP